jgi:hypothetical protein
MSAFDGWVTIGITAYLRPLSLLRLESSIRQRYPDCPVVVVDTGSNLSQARNRLARAVTTPYLLLCEDDFEFIGTTRIEPLLDVLTHDPEVVGVGGVLLEPRGPHCWGHDYWPRGGEILASPSRDPLRRTPAGVVYQTCQLIFNFGLYRRDLFERVPWDEDLPLNEHHDFYFRVSRLGLGKMAVARGVAVRHHKDRPSEEYLCARQRNYIDQANAKHGARFRTELRHEWVGDFASVETGKEVSP